MPHIPADRYWLLTSTTYGTRLPGDKRGFVSNVRDGPGPEVRHNQPGIPLDADMPSLERWSRAHLRGDPVRLDKNQAAAVLAQIRLTAEYRGWQLLAVAILADHIHVVVGVPGDPDSADILGSFKSYASRALNQRWPRPRSGTWWTESGSRRLLPNEQAVHNAIAYVRNQAGALVIWDSEEGHQGADAPRSPEHPPRLASGGEYQGADAPRSPEHARPMPIRIPPESGG